MSKKSSFSSHLILLHGWTFDPTTQKKWQPLATELKRRKITSHYLPLPGLETKLTKAWDLNDYASWLGKELKKIQKKLKKGEKIAILGHSFGGQIVCRFLARNPDAVEQLILVNSAGIRDHGLLALSKRFGFAFIAKLGKIFFPSRQLRKLLYKLAREQDYYQASPLQREIMAKVLSDEIWDDLPKIKAQTLILWGENDTITPPKFADIFTDLIPNNQQVTIAAARHSPVYTHVTEVAKHIESFLK